MKTVLAIVVLSLGGSAVSAQPAAEPAAAAPPASPSRGFGRSGGFVSLGVGTVANVGGQLETYQYDGEGTAASLVVGQRFGMFGLEVGLIRYGMARDGGNTWTNTGLAAAGRFTLPILPVASGYLRAGIEKTWMKPDSNGAEFSGTGWLAGLGAEYKLRVGRLSGGVWAELTRHDATFVSADMKRPGHIDILSAGVTVGF